MPEGPAWRIPAWGRNAADGYTALPSPDFSRSCCAVVRSTTLVLQVGSSAEGALMRKTRLKSQFLAAGMPREQVEIALEHFERHKTAPRIETAGDYAVASAFYQRLDAALPPHDVHSLSARYVISLGTRMAEWEIKAGCIPDDGLRL